MKPPVKLIATALSLLACSGAGALADAVPAAALGPTAVLASARHTRTHTHTRARRARCSSHGRNALRGCKASTRSRARSHVKAHPAPPSQPRHHSEAGAPSSPSPALAQQRAAVAAALSAACANTELPPEEGNIPLVRAAVLCLVNRERAQNGVPPLTDSPQLEAAAESHAGELIADDYFAHVSPTGETPVDRVRETGYIPGPSVGYVIGENLAWGTYGLSTAQSIVSAWIASPGHLANILEAKYTETGIGITPAVPSSLAAGAPGATYAQEFGVIIH